MARRQRATSSFTHDRQHPEKATKIETTSFEDDKDDDVYIWTALVVPGYCNRIYRLLDALIHTYLLTHHGARKYSSCETIYALHSSQNHSFSDISEKDMDFSKLFLEYLSFFLFFPLSISMISIELILADNILPN